MEINRMRSWNEFPGRNPQSIAAYAKAFRESRDSGYRAGARIPRIINRQIFREPIEWDLFPFKNPGDTPKRVPSSRTRILQDFSKDWRDLKPPSSSPSPLPKKEDKIPKRFQKILQGFIGFKGKFLRDHMWSCLTSHINIYNWSWRIFFIRRRFRIPQPISGHLQDIPKNLERLFEESPPFPASYNRVNEWVSRSARRIEGEPGVGGWGRRMGIGSEEGEECVATVTLAHPITREQVNWINRIIVGRQSAEVLIAIGRLIDCIIPALSFTSDQSITKPIPSH